MWMRIAWKVRVAGSFLAPGLWPVARRTISASWPVQLHRGDADVEGDAVDRLDPAVGKRLTHPGKTLRHKRQAPPARSGKSFAILDRLGIAIESEDTGRPLFEYGLGVAAGPEG